MLWQREDLNVSHIERETERSVLIRVPDSGYKGYTFWIPKKFVRKIKNVSERVRVIYPLYFDVTMRKDNHGHSVYIGFALDCVNRPENHKVDEFELEKEYREYVGF